MIAGITIVNATEGCLAAEQFYEDYGDMPPGDIYRLLQAEYGRCIGHVYIGDGIAVGWVFVSRDRYSDCRGDRPMDYYLREAWITLYDECEHGDPCEMIRYHSRERIQTGRRQHMLKSGRVV